MKTEWMDCPHSDHPHPLCDWPSTHRLQFDHQCNIMVYSNQHLLKFMGIHHGHMSKDFDLEKDCFHPEFFCFFALQLPGLSIFCHLVKRLTLRPRHEIHNSWLIIHHSWGAFWNQLAANITHSHRWGYPRPQKTLILICSVLPKTQHKVPSRKD